MEVYMNVSPMIATICVQQCVKMERPFSRHRTALFVLYLHNFREA